MATYTVTPAQSIQAVFDGNDLAPGDIVELLADTIGGSHMWTENVTLGSNDAGSDGNPVVLRGRSGDTCKIKSATGNYAYTHTYGVNYVKYQNLQIDGGIVAAMRLRAATKPEFSNVKMSSADAVDSIGLYIDAAVTSLVADGLDCDGAAGKGIFINAASIGVIQNSLFRNNGNHGLHGNLGGIALSGCDIYDNGGHGHWSATGSAVAQSLTLCQSHDNIALDETYRHGFCFAPTGNLSNFRVDRCLSYNVDLAMCVQASAGSLSDGVITRSIFVGEGQGQTEGGYGLMLAASNASYTISNVTIAHNYIASNDENGGAVYVGHYVDAGVVLKNNIIAHNDGGPVMRFAADAPFIDSDYNIFYSTKAKPFTIGEVDYTFEEYKALSGKDVHSVMLTANPVGADYKLTSAARYAQHNAVIIAGVNDSAQPDRWGNPTLDYPNIGVDQFDYAPGFGPWIPFDSMPTLFLAPTCPGSLLEVQEWKTANVTKRQIDGIK